MTFMLWTIFVLFVLSALGQLMWSIDGGHFKTKGWCVVDATVNFILAGWILWYLAK